MILPSCGCAYRKRMEMSGIQTAMDCRSDLQLDTSVDLESTNLTVNETIEIPMGEPLETCTANFVLVFEHSFKSGRI